MNEKFQQPDAKLDLNTMFFYETVNRLARLGRSSFLFSLINGFLAYYVLRDVADPLILNLWLGGLVIVTSLRSVMVYLFWRLEKSGSLFKLWVIFYLFLIYCSGFFWGIFPLFDAFEAEDWSQAFIIFLIAGMSAGGLVSLYPLLRAAIPYFIIILMPLILALGAGYRQADFAMSVFGCLYLIFLIRSAYILNYAVQKSIRLEIENENLFDFLSSASRGAPTAEMLNEKGKQPAAKASQRQP